MIYDFSVLENTKESFIDQITMQQYNNTTDPTAEGFVAEGELKCVYGMMLLAAARFDHCHMDEARKEFGQAIDAYQAAYNLTPDKKYLRQIKEVREILEKEVKGVNLDVESCDIKFRGIRSENDPDDQLDLASALQGRYGAKRIYTDIEILPVLNFSQTTFRSTIPLGYNPVTELPKPLQLMKKFDVPVQMYAVENTLPEYFEGPGEPIPTNFTQNIERLMEAANELLPGNMSYEQALVLDTLAAELINLGEKYGDYETSIDTARRERKTINMILSEGLDILVSGAVENIQTVLED